MKLINMVLLLASLLFTFSISVQAGEKIYFVQSDHLGTPEILTDQNQNIVWRSSQDPFGGSAPLVEQVTFNMRFPGQYFDQESGLHYNWNRYYDPETGRYVTPDPIGILRDYSNPQLQVAIEMGSLYETEFAGEELNHLYGYVGQNPLYWIDRHGLAEHTSGARPSTKGKHQKGNARRGRDGGGEKGDNSRRKPRKRPKGHSGPWPPAGFPLITPLPLEDLLKDYSCGFLNEDGSFPAHCYPVPSC